MNKMAISASTIVDALEDIGTDIQVVKGPKRVKTAAKLDILQSVKNTVMKNQNATAAVGGAVLGAGVGYDQNKSFTGAVSGAAIGAGAGFAAAKGVKYLKSPEAAIAPEAAAAATTTEQVIAPASKGELRYNLARHRESGRAHDSRLKGMRAAAKKAPPSDNLREGEFRITKGQGNPQTPVQVNSHKSFNIWNMFRKTGGAKSTASIGKLINGGLSDAGKYISKNPNTTYGVAGATAGGLYGASNEDHPLSSAVAGAVTGGAVGLTYGAHHKTINKQVGKWLDSAKVTTKKK